MRATFGSSDAMYVQELLGGAGVNSPRSRCPVAAGRSGARSSDRPEPPVGGRGETRGRIGRGVEVAPILLAWAECGIGERVDGWGRSVAVEGSTPEEQRSPLACAGLRGCYRIDERWRGSRRARRGESG